MGQTAPALCVDCGGPFKLKEPAPYRDPNLRPLLALLDSFSKCSDHSRVHMNYAQLMSEYEKYKKGKP
jgi:hypothetical protein